MSLSPQCYRRFGFSALEISLPKRLCSVRLSPKGPAPAHFSHDHIGRRFHMSAAQMKATLVLFI